MQVESLPLRLTPRWKFITGLLLLTLTLLLLHAVTAILAPFVAAIITAYIFNPLVSFLQQRTRLKRVIWVGILYICAFTLLYGLGNLLWPKLTAQYAWLVKQRIPFIIANIATVFEGRKTFEIIPGMVINLVPLEDQLIGVISDLGRTLSGNVPGLVFTALEAVLYTLVYLIVTFYLLLQSPELKTWAIRQIAPPYRAEICELGQQIDQVLGAYIRGQLFLILIMSVMLYIPLSILHVPSALVIAIASGTLELIPIIGPWSAAGIAMTVAFFQPHVPYGLSSGSLAGLLGIIYFVLRQIEDNFIIPNVVGHLVKLHPVIVIFAIMAGGAIGGMFGLLISIPVAAVIRILLMYLYPKLLESHEIPPEAKIPELQSMESEPKAPKP